MAPRSRAAKTLRKVKKDLKLKGNGKKNGARMRRRDATIVLAQGAVAAPRRNFGTGKISHRGHKIGELRKLLDARIPKTLGLPRAVGPYTIIRTTGFYSITSKFCLFAPIWSDYQHKWCDWCGVFGVSGIADVVTSNNTMALNMPMDGLQEACEVVPASMTVQVMNPATLQTADGAFAMCRVNQQLPLGQSPAGLTYDNMSARVISYYSPRMLTGGKLALRGVKCNSYPLDMSDYANFAPVHKQIGAFTWDRYIRPAALAPIVFAQPPGEEAKKLDFMVTIEWRVRFDPGNPATSSHEYHETLSDEAWNGLMKAEAMAGHAVKELSEDVAATGAI